MGSVKDSAGFLIMFSTYFLSHDLFSWPVLMTCSHDLFSWPVLMTCPYDRLVLISFYDSFVLMTVLFLWLFCSYDCFVLMTVLFLWLFCSYDCFVLMTVLFLWLFCSYDCFVLMTVLFLWLFCSYDCFVLMTVLFSWPFITASVLFGILMVIKGLLFSSSLVLETILERQSSRDNLLICFSRLLYLLLQYTCSSSIPLLPSLLYNST